MSAWGPEESAEVFVHDVPADIASASERLIGIPGPGMFREPWPLSDGAASGRESVSSW